jgi:hypothetical protein
MQLRCTDRNGVRSGILRWNRYFFGRPENQDLAPSQRKVEGIVKSVLGCVKGVLSIQGELGSIESSSLLHRQRIVGSAAATSLDGGSILAYTVVAAAGPQSPPQTLDGELVDESSPGGYRRPALSASRGRTPVTWPVRPRADRARRGECQAGVAGFVVGSRPRHATFHLGRVTPT